MSSSPSAATSPARSPSRTSSVSIAKSRRPGDRRRSQRGQQRPHLGGLQAAAARPAALATDGTAAASGPPIRPCTWQNPSSDRNADTVRCAVFGLRSPVTASTNPTTSALDRPARSTPSAVARADHERPDELGITSGGRGPDPPFADQVTAITLQQHLDRALRHHRPRRGATPSPRRYPSSGDNAFGER